MRISAKSSEISPKAGDIRLDQAGTAALILCRVSPRKWLICWLPLCYGRECREHQRIARRLPAPGRFSTAGAKVIEYRLFAFVQLANLPCSVRCNSLVIVRLVKLVSESWILENKRFYFIIASGLLPLRLCFIWPS
ncbi:hypothetical protein KCP70_16875 [Salmonella enterica subsp. enterica]|nr:hypothetical protein KCP70_16875 [Salmonella enterica subsp. enterica]